MSRRALKCGLGLACVAVTALVAAPVRAEEPGGSAAAAVPADDEPSRAARAAATRAASLRFDWPELRCPDRDSVVASLANVDLAARDPLGDEEQLPEAAAIDPSWVEARALQGADHETSRLELVIHARGRTLARIVDLTGPCSERAVVVAAIIERALRPGHGSETVASASAADTQEFEVTLAPQGDPDAAPAPVPLPAVDDAELGRALLDRQPLWILNGALVVLGGEGPTFRGGADAELRYEFSWDLFAVLRLSYRSPRIHRVGPATVRIDDAWAALGLQIGSPDAAIALQTTAIVQVVWSHGEGLQKEYNVVSANPGVTMGACYQKAFETWGFEGCVRGFGFLRRQEIHINDSPVLGLPRVGGELAIGVSYQI